MASYVVLARKYRPRDFSQMVGQDAVVRALSNALSTGRLHHAYLFTGTRGVGKTTVSRILAKSLNCQGADGQGGVTATPCGVCAACVEIDAGRFVDYTELDAASNRGVAEVQALLEQAVYKPVQGRYKVFMIDEVHMLTGHAFNAMLKTLEEPPEYLKFVLATTDPQKVPVTVLSRCLQFNLRPMAPQTVAEHLARVLAAEGIDYDDLALELLARAARGSMRDALSLTDQAIAYGGGVLRADGVRQMLGSADRTLLWRLLDALAAGHGQGVLAAVDDMRNHGLPAASMLDELVAVLQAVAVTQAVPEAALAGGGVEREQVAAVAAALSAEETQLLYSVCLHGRQELGLAVDEYAGLTMVLLRFLAFKQPATPAVEKKSPLTPADLDSGPRASADAPDRPSARTASVALASEAGVAGGAEANVAVGDAGRSSQAVSDAVAAPVPAAAPAIAAAPAVAAAVDGLAMAGSTDAAGAAETACPDGFAPNAAVAPAGPAGSGGADGPRAWAGFWHQTVMALIEGEHIGALVRELALQSELIDRQAQRWTLQVEAEALAQPALAERLQAALAQLGHSVQLTVVLGRVAETPARRLARAAQARQAQAAAWVAADAWTQELVRAYGAKIVPGSVAAL